MQFAEHPLRTFILNLPDLSGVYKYFDNNDVIIYVGKAKNLKKRVSSYFTKDDHPAKTKLLVKQIQRIEYTIVNTEKDALLLENSLIKQLQPKFNINLKDDKTYPYIKIFNERFPRVIFTRNKIDDGSEYFGPYTSVFNVRYIYNLLKEMYPIRTCSYNLSKENIRKKKFKVCLEYHLGNCLGPCEALQTEEDYNRNIEQIRNILKGKTRVVKDILREEIEIYAQQLAFEKAADLKKKLDALNEYIENSIVSNLETEDAHIFGYVENETKAFINYLYIYDGNIVQTKSFFIQKNIEEDKEDILTMAIVEQIGLLKNKALVLLPFDISFSDESYQFFVPKIGEKKKLVELAQKNAFVQMQKTIAHTKTPKSERILELMKSELKLKSLPVHIECFDNSNFHGDYPVSACVVFKNAQPSKKDYRHFHVKTVVGPNDFDTMKEAVFRRYHRLLEEEADLPQLVVIDGGKGQLSVAMESLKKLNLENEIQLISIAKRLEEIYYPNDSIPLHLNVKSETLKVLQHIRDEAHRFGITFHRHIRDKGTLQTELTKIEGVGELSAQKLLAEIGSVEQIKSASLNQLEKVVGKRIAKKVYDYYLQ
ncbi:MAG TPA: excinuclease ABC subunit UvrC [Chitinophagales bacterium]|nr:excinuclease ABC subunit UvrC [Chitinophagales bacterium]HMU97593.1 excinuclease ABC subunit UvrC [Chitinophagales bacterium]HMV02448.1 excinuclease ABC subunit UvrC [Chitinophagales bacterium]HMW93624.1 excinuclease ABC subunit UvrC [Chitinophagales bacterium]HMY41650.1 excinuclease ABC subunit UvrC [Chitinophagales bacterium]